jgi:hypothetical protein
MTHAKFKPKRERNPKADALARLRARWEQDHEDAEWKPEKEPAIGQMLRAVPGGIPAVIAALRLHSDPDAVSFIQTYNSLPEDYRRRVCIEDIAFASGFGSLRLAEVAQTAMFLYGQMKTKLLLFSAMPEVMQATIKAATDEVPIVAFDAKLGANRVVGRTNGDVRAMEMFHKMSGMMPLPKGAPIAIQNNFGEQEQEKPKASPLWKTPEERLREFQDMTEPKRLPSPESKPLPLGGHIDTMQAETVEILAER